MLPVTLAKAFFCVVAALLGYYVTLYYAGLFGLIGRARVLGWGRFFGLLMRAMGRAIQKMLVPYLGVAILGAAGHTLAAPEDRPLVLFVTLMVALVVGLRAGVQSNFDIIAESGGPTDHPVARALGIAAGVLAGAGAVTVLFLLG